MITPKKWEKKEVKTNNIDIDLLTKEIMIKLKFALSLFVNSKNQTQNPPHNGCPLHLGGNWRRGSISAKSLWLHAQKIKEQIEPLIILMQRTS